MRILAAGERDRRGRRHIGNFVETKNVIVGKGSKANHLTYLGDATCGHGRERGRRGDYVQL